MIFKKYWLASRSGDTLLVFSSKSETDCRLLSDSYGQASPKPPPRSGGNASDEELRTWVSPNQNPISRVSSTLNCCLHNNTPLLQGAEQPQELEVSSKCRYTDDLFCSVAVTRILHLHSRTIGLLDQSFEMQPDSTSGSQGVHI